MNWEILLLFVIGLVFLKIRSLGFEYTTLDLPIPRPDIHAQGAKESEDHEFCEIYWNRALSALGHVGWELVLVCDNKKKDGGLFIGKVIFRRGSWHRDFGKGITIDMGKMQMNIWEEVRKRRKSIIKSI